MTKTTTPETAKPPETGNDAPPAADQLTGALSDANARILELERQLEAGYVKVTTLEQDLEAGNAKVTTLEQDLEAANAKIAKLEAAPPAAKPGKGKARRIEAGQVKDPIEGYSDDDRAYAPAEALLGEVQAAEQVEVAFSNGKVEIPGIAPAIITGDAWRVTAAGLQLTLPELLVHGPAAGAAAFELGGYGLYLDGKLAAFSPRDRLEIRAGATMNLAPDIVF